VRQVPAPSTGFVRELRAREVAAVAMALGAGRERKEDPVDHAVGIVCRAKHGDRAERGEPLAEIHARDEEAADAAEAALLAAYEIGEEPEPRPLVLEVIH
jgi:thymidine phosphorylase